MSLSPLFWGWLILGLALVGLEVFVPGVFLLFFGLAAAGLAILTALAPELPIAYQLTLYAVLAIVMVVCAKLATRKRPQAPSELNNERISLVGQVFAVEQAFETGRGRIRVGDSSYLAACALEDSADLVEGRRVRVSKLEDDLLWVVAAG